MHTEEQPWLPCIASAKRAKRNVPLGIATWWVVDPATGPSRRRTVKRAQPSSDAQMRRNSSRGSASPSTYRGGSGRRRKRRSNRLAKCAAFIVGAYALVASLFYYLSLIHI